MGSKRCRCCGRWYRPDPRTARFQKACARPACRRARKLRADRDWLARHPGYGAGRRLKVRAWAKAYPSYWRRYRRGHPAYVGWDNRRRWKALKRARCSAKQDAIRGIFVEKLLAVRAAAPKSAAKQDAMARRMDALLDAMLWKAGAAKQDDMARTPALAG